MVNIIITVVIHTATSGPFFTKTGYCLDALVEQVKLTKVGIEVDGPTHFVGRKAMGWDTSEKQASEYSGHDFSRFCALLGVEQTW